MIAGVVVVAHVYRHLDDSIRDKVQIALGRQFHGLEVEVRGAELVDGKGILVWGVTLNDPTMDASQPMVAHIDEMQLSCNTDLSELLTAEPVIRSVLIRRPTIRVVHGADGVWNFERLLTMHAPSHSPCSVAVEDGTLEILDLARPQAEPVKLRGVNGSFEPTAPTEGGTPVDPSIRRLQGKMASDHFRQASMEGFVRADGTRWSVSGKIEGLSLSPALHDGLPVLITDKLSALRPVRGDGYLEFRVAYDAALASPYQFHVAARLQNGRIEDARLPHPLSDVQASIRCDAEGWILEQFSAKTGQTTFRLSGRQIGYKPNAPMELAAEVRRLDLDRAVRDALPERFKDLWYKYLPAGLIDVDARAAFDGQKWTPEAVVQCENVSFSHHKFPYRVEGSRGALRLKDDALDLQLSSQNGDAGVSVTGRIQSPFSGGTGWVEIRAEGVPLDEKFAAALPERNRAVFRSLGATGACGVFARLWRDKPDEALHQHFIANVNRGTLRYERFAYPVSEVRGTIEMLDGAWQFREFEGVNRGGRMTLDGTLSTSAAGHEVVLRVAGTNIPLDDELRDALLPNIRGIWNELRPRGAIDFSADVRFVPEDHRVAIALRAEPRGDNTSIEPANFPYRLERLSGGIGFADGIVTFDNVKASHGSARFSSTGSCESPPDGGWRLRLTSFNADGLAVDRDLIQAMPNRLRRAVSDMNVTGPLNLRGAVEMWRGPRTDENVQMKWNVRLGAQRAGIDCGVKLENIRGEVGLNGSFDGRSFRSRGELALDSLTHKDIQLVQVLGPFWVDDQQMVFGSWVDRPRNGAPPAADQPAPRSITGSAFGGAVHGDGMVLFGQTPRYHIQAGMAQADLTRCAREAFSTKLDYRGKLFASIDLKGAGRSMNAVTGQGSIRLREANVYQLPVMISMLKLLSIRQPDTNAFSQSDIDFRMAGNHIYLDPIDFRGDAISLLGKGELNAENQQLQLTFYSMVGRANGYIPILRELVGGASQQIMQIHVTGTVGDPQVRREALPAVNEVLQMFRSSSSESGEPIEGPR